MAAARKKPKSSKNQSVRFIEASKATDADQAAFERAFQKIVKPKTAKAKRAK